VIQAVWDEWYGKTPFPCFEFAAWRRTDDDGVEHLDIMGEDYTFCFRAAALGFPATVDTEIEAGHNKTVTFTSAHFWAQVPEHAIPSKNYAVIPVKDGLKMTKNLLAQLEEQGHVAGVLVIDNGSGPETKAWLARQSFAEVIEMPGAGIHAMWNAGAEWACSRWRKPNIAFLNNDLELGDAMLGKLGMALRSAPELVAVCPNYDGRPGEGVTQLQGICADRYDGSGGLSGFAFMVKGELFDQYRFPEDAMWWYGDNDLTLTLDAMGAAYGMAHDATVVHLDGGGKTGTWDDPKMQAQLAKDRAAFMAKWQPLLAGEAA
jgi:GT2 family glycosyltransferase